MNTTSHNEQVPVTVIGGFLGSGKNTLLNRVLRESHGVRYAVMVNDFGALAIDEMLVREHQGDTISFANGCVCCSLGDNLVDSIDQMLARDPPPEQFLVEVSGVANPKAIADVATLHPRLRRDLIVSMVDVGSVLDRLQDQRLTETVHMQLVSADLLVLNKTDLVDAAQLGVVKEQLQSLTSAPSICVEQAELPIDVLSPSAIELLATSAVGAQSDDVKVLAERRRLRGTGQDNVAQRQAHVPTQQFSRALVSPARNLAVADVKEILLAYRDILVRAKGFVTEAGATPVRWLVQFSGTRVDVSRVESVVDIHWKSVESDACLDTGLVLIGVEPLDQLQQALEGGHCEAMSTSPQPTVS